jgi:hypothetical protein
MNAGQRNVIKFALVLIGLVVAYLWWNHKEDAPGIVLSLVWSISPIVAVAIVMYVSAGREPEKWS